MIGIGTIVPVCPINASGDEWISSNITLTGTHVENVSSGSGASHTTGASSATSTSSQGAPASTSADWDHTWSRTYTRAGNPPDYDAYATADLGATAVAFGQEAGTATASASSTTAITGIPNASISDSAHAGATSGGPYFQGDDNLFVGSAGPLNTTTTVSIRLGTHTSASSTGTGQGYTDNVSGTGAWN